MYKKNVMHVQSCCFANLNLLLFLPSSLPSPSSLLKLPEGAKESVRIKRVEFRENVRAYFHQGGTRNTVRNNEVSLRIERMSVTRGSTI